MQTYAQQGEAKVVLVNGETYYGKIIAVSDSLLLIKSFPNTVSIKRSQVLYLLPNSPVLETLNIEPTAFSDELRMPYAPMSKKIRSEIDYSLAIRSPFGLRTGYTLWYALENDWHVGLGTSFQVWRHGMLNISAHGRKYLTKNKILKPFLDVELGLSYTEFLLQNGWMPRIEYDFSSVKQASFGFGCFFDTGMDVGFALKTAWQGTYYTLVQEPWPTNRIEGEYFIGTIALSGSLIF